VIDETIEVRKTEESTCSEVFEDELSVESGNAHQDVNNIESPLVKYCQNQKINLLKKHK